jgi:hypothetical protein
VVEPPEFHWIDIAVLITDGARFISTFESFPAEEK